MNISKNLTIALGGTALYYLSAHPISGLIGGLILGTFGGLLPLISMLYLALYLYEVLSPRMHITKKYFVISFLLVTILFTLAFDKFVYNLHGIGGDEGCMCLYYTTESGTGRPAEFDKYLLQNTYGMKYFQYTTEAYLKGIHLGL